jgi:electron transfer flavoprotein alpha/beta subunit
VIVGTTSAARGVERPILRSDRSAVDLAVRRLKGFVEAFSFSNDDSLRYALAAGATSAQAIERHDDIEFDVALIGSGACGALGDLLPAMLAERRQAALVVEVLDIDRDGEGLRVTRDLGRGAQEILRVKAPAVLVISENAPRPSYVSRYRISRVGRKMTFNQRRTDHSNDAPRIADDSWEAVKPRVKLSDVVSRTTGAAADRMNRLMGAVSDSDGDSSDVIKSDAVTCARHLVRYLAHHGFVERSADRIASSVETQDLAAPTKDEPAEPPAQSEPARNKKRGPRPIEKGNSRSRRGPKPLDQ